MSVSFPNKSALIGCLRDDWLKKRESSVIFRYYRGKKEKEIAAALEEGTDLSKISDNYVRLSVARRRFEEHENEISRRSYLDVFLELKSRKGKLPKKYQNITPGIINTVVNRAADGILDTLLRGQITDFFYREGFYTKEIKSRVTGRKNQNIDVIELLDFYQNSVEEQIPEDRFILSDGFIKESLDILNSLRKTGLTDVFVPLYISPESGAILCILGSEYCSRHERERTCYPCILSFKELRTDDPLANFYIDEEDLMNTLMVMDRKEFDMLIPAIEEFNRRGSVNFEGYRGINLSLSGIDKGRFARYFDPDPGYDEDEDMKIMDDYTSIEQNALSKKPKADRGSSGL